MNDGAAVAQGAVQRDYVVVLRAPSSARFVPEKGWEVNLQVPQMALRDIRIRAFTRWDSVAGGTLPREMVVEVRGNASSFQESVAKFTQLGRTAATIAGFVANVQVGLAEVHLAFESTGSSLSREFLETFLPDEHGGAREGRSIRLHLMEKVYLAYVSLQNDGPRVDRAVRQYELALRNWTFGGEHLALSHLWMAVEALTDAVIRHEERARGLSKQELAEALGIDIGDSERPWQAQIKHSARQALIFHGDESTYSEARNGRNGLEHGFMELDEVSRRAVQCADQTFYHVRRTILDLLGLSTEVIDELMDIRPKDVQSRRKVIRGLLTGRAEDPAQPGELYPYLEWRSTVQSVIRDGAKFDAKEKDRITIRTHPAVGFKLTALEVVGRLEDGATPIEVDGDDLVEEEMGSAPSGLLDRVRGLVDLTVESQMESKYSLPQQLVFYMFGQVIAFLQGITVLVNAEQPVECLPLLGGLIELAGRLEQMTDEASSGFGMAVRLALDSLDAIGADAEHHDRAASVLRTAALEASLDIPQTLKSVDEASIAQRLLVEVDFARKVSVGDYSTILLHVLRDDPNTAGFHVTLRPQGLTELVCSATAMATLESMTAAAELLGWKIDLDTLSAVLAEATARNGAAGEQNLMPHSDEAGVADGPDSATSRKA